MSPYKFEFKRVGDHISVDLARKGVGILKDAALIYGGFAGDPRISIPLDKPMSISVLSQMLDDLSIWVEAKMDQNYPHY